MSAQAQQLEVRFECLGLADLDDVMRIERLSYGHPWSRGAFEDSIAAGYQMQRLLAGNALLGYFVAMLGVDEVHLLNITVAPSHRQRGWAKLMLEALGLWSRGQGAKSLLLEVRVS
ncbi:MAG: GNAT family N-acetyltransferase, partial [Betaproteobacteria bacterium]|nr:GNAT family N-acetyltransferase [Betaproteobacteria bacterium]NDE73891.1 GNAT family N-acetyltransferase [Betaproteobacteria bacterium]